MANQWFRMYSDFLSDPKMISLAFEDQRHFIGILALKSDGTLDQQCEAKLLERIIAQRLWIDYAILSDVKKRLVSSGLIEESWQPIAWEKRQFVSDSSAERTRAYRDRIKQSHCDVTVTSPDTDTDTDTDTEAEKIKESVPKKSPSGLLEGIDPQIASDYLAIRKAKKSPLTATALDAIKREATTAGLLLEDALRISCENNWCGFKAAWLLNQKNKGSTSIEESNRAATAGWMPPEMREKNHAAK